MCHSTPGILTSGTDRLEHSDSSTDTMAPGYTTKSFPEVVPSKSSSTPDSVTSASRQQPSSYLELFNARRKLGKHLKRQIAIREHQISAANCQGSNSGRSKAIRSWIRKVHCPDIQTRTERNYAGMFQHEMKGRAARDHRMLSAQSKCAYPPLLNEPGRSAHSDSWMSPAIADKDVSQSNIRVRNPVIKHSLFGCGIGSQNHNSYLDRGRYVKGEKRKHETASSCYPDPELVRIYGGSQTSLDVRKSPRKDRHVQHNSDQDRTSSGDIPEANHSDTYGSTSCGIRLSTDEHRQLGRESPQIPAGHGKLSDRAFSEEVSLSSSVKGIMKTQNENGRRSESLSADSSCTENGSARRVRFKCPEKDLVFTRNPRSVSKQSRGVGLCDDDIPNELDYGMKYGRYVNYPNEPREQGEMRRTRSHKSEKDRHFRSTASVTISPLYSKGEVSTLERNIPTTQQYQNVEDYDDLYPTNGEATRWNDICMDCGHVEILTLKKLNHMERSRQRLVSNAVHDMTHDANSSLNHWQARCQQHTAKCRFSPQRYSRTTTWEVISVGSNEDSEDGRASGDGLITQDNVGSNMRPNGIDTGRGYFRNECNNLRFDTEIDKRHGYHVDMGSNRSCFSWPDSRAEDDHLSTPGELPNTDLETSKRQQAAVENLERALRQGVMQAVSTNDKNNFKNEPTICHQRCTSGHVDLIDRKALDERIKALQNEVPLPLRVRYRHQQDR
ncbi:uncharacterized protein [Argopecten irradians]|uniref:uncharacterized protein n=1 Tax=Argopecten irradians TaxID=31199 RepID=UPI00371AEAA1